MQMRMAKRRMVLALGLGILASTQSFVDDNETTKTEIESSHGAKKNGWAATDTWTISFLHGVLVGIVK